jgi:type I restriction enzyme S subunit
MSEKVKLGKLAEIVSGSTPKTNIKEYWNGDTLWITPAEIKEDDYYIADTQRKITQLAVEKTNLRLLPKGTILLSSRAPIGKIAICDNDMYCNQGFKNIICSEKLNNRYVYYYLKYNIEYLKSLGRGATFKEISKGIVENLEIPFKDIKEQITIANKLDKITEIIKIRKEQIKHFDEIIKSQFVEMFEKENRHVNLEDVCIFINGDRGKNYPSADKISKDSNGVLFINAGLLTNNGVDWENMNYISEETYNKLGSGKIQKDDILYCLRGSLGKHAIIDFDNKGAIASSLVILRADQSKIQPNFLLIQLGMDEIVKQQIQANNGSSQPNLSASSVKKYKIKLPDVESQSKFVNIVKQIDKQKFEIENSLKEMQELYESLMEKYFG